MGSLVMVLALVGCGGRTPPVARPDTPATTLVRTPWPTRVHASSTPLMPRAVTSFGAAELGGDVYAFGGYFGVPHAYSRDGQSGELLRLAKDAATFEAVSTTEPTQSAALVGARGQLVRLGGMRAKNASGEPESMASLDEVAAFDPFARTWSALPKLPTPRSSHAAAVLGDSIYVVGGWQLAGDAADGRFSDELLALDLTTRTYRKLPQPFKRRALAAAALDGKLVVVGGMDEHAKVTREVSVFDPASGAWSRAADLPVDGFGVAAASNGDVLYASARDGTVYALAEPTGAWRVVTQLAFPRFFHQLLVRGDELLALGGISGMHNGPRVREVEVVSLTTPAPRVLAFTLDNPLRGKNRQGVFVDGNALYVFGGNRSMAQHDFGPDDFVADAARLDLASLTFTPIAPLPVPRQTMQTLVSGESALVLGGFGHDGTQARAHADAFRYDLATDSWSRDASVLPTPRTQFGLIEANGARWVFGGLDFKPEARGEAQFDHPTSVLRAAPGEPFRPSGIELPRPRRAFGGALLDGHYYLVGGMAGGFGPVTQCDVLELASAKWSELPCPAVRISPQLVALEGKLYLAGGSSAGPDGQLTPNRSIEVYDPKTRAWSVLLAELPIEARHLTMLPFAGGLLLYSTHDEQGRAHVAIVRP